MSELEHVQDHPPEELPVFKSGDYDEHVETWRSLEELAEDARWKQAAVAASLTARWGEKTKVVSEFASRVGCSASRVYEYAVTWNKFASARKSEILSFHHHTVAARDPEPEHVVERAEIEGWSTRETQGYVAERRDAVEGKPDPASVPMRTCPTCDGDGEIPVETRTEGA